MPDTKLSPAAQMEYDKREAAMARTALDAGENLNMAYLDFLKALASKKIPDLADVEAKGQGVDAWNKSHEDHAIATELQAYAASQLTGDISAAVAKLPERASLDDLLARLMLSEKPDDRAWPFQLFLEHEAEATVDEQMELHPRSLSRNETITEMVRVRLEHLKHGDIPQLAQHDIMDSFRSWWDSQAQKWRESRRGGRSLELSNETKQKAMRERLEKIAKLLPAWRLGAGMDMKNLKIECQSNGLFTSDRTLRRDLAMMLKIPLADKQGNGRYRRHREKK